MVKKTLSLGGQFCTESRRNNVINTNSRLEHFLQKNCSEKFHKNLQGNISENY